MKKYFTLKKLLSNFFILKRAAIALEVAMIAPILIMFLFAIIETAIMISNRSGIEEVMRTAARMSFSSGALKTYAADQGWPASLDNDRILVRFMSERLSSFLRNSTGDKIRITRKIYTDSARLAANDPSSPPATITVGVGTNFPGNPVSGNYISLTTRYEYEYIGPIHNLIPGLPNNQIITSELFYRKD